MSLSKPCAYSDMPFDRLVWFFTAYLARLRDAGEEEHRQASAVFTTDRLTENSPTHTASVDEESSGR